MEPRKVETNKPSQVQKQAKKLRFRIEKLEERIAPNKGGIPNGGGGRFGGRYCT